MRRPIRVKSFSTLSKRFFISSVQPSPNGELAPLENLVCSLPHSATLLHGRSPFLCALSTIQHWERIASRRRPAFSLENNTGLARSGESVLWSENNSVTQTF